MKKKRYFLDQDNDGHWYIVNAEFRAEWDAWIALDSDDEAAWALPCYAATLAGHPSNVEFSDPEGR